MRGARIDYVTRPSAVIDVTYQIECAQGGETSARKRFVKAAAILDEKFVVAENLVLNNYREIGDWKRDASEAIFNQTQCYVDKLSYEIKTKELTEVLAWAIINDVKPTQK